MTKTKYMQRLIEKWISQGCALEDLESSGPKHIVSKLRARENIE